MKFGQVYRKNCKILILLFFSVLFGTSGSVYSNGVIEFLSWTNQGLMGRVKLSHREMYSVFKSRGEITTNYTGKSVVKFNANGQALEKIHIIVSPLGRSGSRSITVYKYDDKSRLTGITSSNRPYRSARSSHSPGPRGP